MSIPTNQHPLYHQDVLQVLLSAFQLVPTSQNEPSLKKSQTDTLPPMPLIIEGYWFSDMDVKILWGFSRKSKPRTIHTNITNVSFPGHLFLNLT